MRGYSYRGDDVWKGVVAGALGGLAGAWLMNQYWIGVGKAEQELNARFSSNGHGPRQEAQTQEMKAGDSVDYDDSGDATQRAANKLFKAVFGRPLTADEKRIGGPIVHYGFGAVMGAVYGGAAETVPQVRSGFGAGFATALFVGMDELAVPALGFGRWPRSAAELPKHAEAWGAHLVYGATTELVRRVVRSAW
jgi:putative membrane protein